MPQEKSPICFNIEALERFKEEQKQKWIAVGMEMVKVHDKPSPETKQTFKTMEEKMTKIEVKMQKLEGNQDLHGEILKRIEEKIDKQDDNLNKHTDVHEKLPLQFASKQTEKDLADLKTISEQRTYDWFKFAIIQFVLLVLSLIIYNKLGL